MKSEEDESRKDESKKEGFARALEGKKIPILTLDNKWYQLLDSESRTRVHELEEQLNALLKRQGKLNNEVKEIKKLKKRLMDEIVSMMGGAEEGEDEESAQKTEQDRRLVEECNEKLENCQDELLDLPREIERSNFNLMLATMECCYEIMSENETDIQEMARWVAEIRVELKKRLVRKQEMERQNFAIYSYMHDVFGAEVVDIFDMHYDPEEPGS